VAALLLAAASAVDGDPRALLRAAIGAAALWAFYFLLVLIYPRGMGFGDVKLAGVLGGYLAWLGWSQLAVGAFLGFLLGGIGGAAMMAAGRAGRKTMIPFGPFMIAGAWVGIVAGAPIGRAYLSLAGL
jgi:leader peptidase (prepilin peptidase)/N-methyltransferase